MLSRQLRFPSCALAFAIAATLASGVASAQDPAPQPQAPAPAPYPQQPAPYPQQPAPYPQQPAPYPQQPAPYPQQPAPYPQQYAPQPAPYPYAPQAAPYPYAPAPIIVAPAPQAAPVGPRKITDWEEGEPIPAGYHKVSHVRVSLIVAGIATFVAVYLPTALAGAILTDVGDNTTCGTSCTSAKPLLIPLAGPWIVLPHSGSATGDFFLVLDGIAQAAGIGMLIGGIAAPKVELVSDRVGKVEVQPTPLLFGTSGGGLGVRGTF